MLNLEIIAEKLKTIDYLFWKLKVYRDKELINELEYEIYDFCISIADQRSLYLKNLYELEREIDIKFNEIRQKFNSDIATTKYIRSKMREQITDLEHQKEIIENIETKKRIITRLADHINSMRIWDLADAKRQ